MKIGLTPIRRSIFSAPDVIKYAGLTRKRLEEPGVELVDITDINGEGLLHDEGDRLKIEGKFCREGIGGLFFPYCSLGTEYVVTRMARDLNVPVLSWEPRDEWPDEDGVRLGDSQCGLSATEEVLRRFQVPFTYMTNCHLEDAESERGIRDFLAVCNVVGAPKSTRILQVAPKSFDFWPIMCNEGELLEKSNTQLVPIPVPEFTTQVKPAKEEGREAKCMMEHCRQTMDVRVREEELENTAAMKVATKRLAIKYGCNAATIQCWNAPQGELGIIPYMTNSLLDKEGLPVVCKTDIYGTTMVVMVEAAAMDGARGFFADWTVRHPDNENGELPQHCGSWPVSVVQEKPVIGYPLASNHPGAAEALAKYGDVTLARFDGDNDKYSMPVGSIEGVEGLYIEGTYPWVGMGDLKRLEDKLACGPRAHCCVEIHKKVVPMFYEACKYIGMKPGLHDPVKEEVKAYTRGE